MESSGASRCARHFHTICRGIAGNFGRYLALGALLVLAFGSAYARPSMEGPSEYEVKAAFLYNFAKYVEWPDESAGRVSQIVIVVIGQDPFGPLLDEMVSGKTVRGRSLTVRRATTIEEIGDCHILFVGAAEERRFTEVLRATAGRSILTVGEGEQFANRGGVIAFRLEDNRVRFDINRKAAERSQITISSQLLKLARVVREPRGSGGAQ